MGQALLKTFKPQVFQGFQSALSGRVRRKAQIQRAESHIFEHCGEKELILRMLEDKTHFAAQLIKVFFAAQGLSMKANQAAAAAAQDP